MCCANSWEDADLVKLLMVLGAVALMGGCRFWYKPVPVANAIGEAEVVLAGDTVNVHKGERFEVYGPTSEAVYDGYEQLNRAYRAFERYFGVTPVRLAFILERDSISPIDSATARGFRERGFTLVQYARPRGARTRQRYSALDYGGVLWPIAPTAARRLLLEFARAQHGSSGPARSDTELLELFPLWYRAAVFRLVGDASSATRDLELVREKRNVLIPFRDMLPMVRAASADSLIDPSRSEDADEFTRTLAAQSGQLARYLVEREGVAVIGRFGRAYVARTPLSELLKGLKTPPRDVQELDNRWRAWIDTREQ